MNTTSPFTTEAAQLEKMRSQITHDIEAMQQKEANLKEYEQRLRLLVEHAESRPPQIPNQYFVSSGGDPRYSAAELDSQWEKYERAHALLEAARRGLTDDRLAMKEREERLTAREVEVARREGWIRVREQELESLAQAKAKEAADHKARPTFTSAPFLAAKNLFTRHG